MVSAIVAIVRCGMRRVNPQVRGRVRGSADSVLPDRVSVVPATAVVRRGSAAIVRGRAAVPVVPARGAVHVLVAGGASGVASFGLP